MSKRAPARSGGPQPLHLFLIFIGIGLGTILLQQPLRFALLCTVLVLLSLAHRGSHSVQLQFTLPNVGRGAAVGAVIGIPLLLFLAENARSLNARLYATEDTAGLFYQLCFAYAPAEEYFFRGILQPRLGIWLVTGLYAVTALVYFMPHVPLMLALIAMVGMALVGLVCAGVKEQYGLAAAVACHAMMSFLLQVAPALIGWLRVVLF